MNKMIFRLKKQTSVQSGLSPEEQLELRIKRKRKLIKSLKHDAVIKTAGTAIALFITFTYIFGIALAPSNDMFPAVHEGDLLIYYRPGRIIDTDIVLYDDPEGALRIGRVEGCRGETVGRTDGGLLTINGNIQPVQKRCGLYDETFAGEKDISGEIKSGEHLILGDRRETASDSRTFGLIPRKAIKGKVFTIIRRRPL